MVGKEVEAALSHTDHEVKERCYAVFRKRSITDLCEDSGHVCFQPGKFALTFLCYQNADSHPNFSYKLIKPLLFSTSFTPQVKANYWESGKTDLDSQRV